MKTGFGAIRLQYEHNKTKSPILEYLFLKRAKVMHYLLEDDWKLSLQMNSTLFIGTWKSSLCFSVWELRSNRCFPRGTFILILSFTYFILISWESPNYSTICFSLPEFHIRKNYLGFTDLPDYRGASRTSSHLPAQGRKLLLTVTITESQPLPEQFLCQTIHSSVLLPRPLIIHILLLFDPSYYYVSSILPFMVIFLSSFIRLQHSSNHKIQCTF